jgi:hypothetical protein
LAVESHGGYLCRYEDVDASWLQGIARSAIEEDGQLAQDCGLQITVVGKPGVVRFAFDAPFSYGRTGARWYLTHHSLARRLSEHLGLTVHAYVFDPDDIEQVVSFGNGRRVGGETVRYEDAELPDDDDEEAFARVAQRWPLGHLARVFGVAREELIRLPRRPTLLIDLSNPQPPQPLWQLFPEPIRARRSHELYQVR